MVEERVLEAGREVDLGGLDLRESVEQLVGQRRGAVLDASARPVPTGGLAQLSRTSKSRATSATPPSGSGTPPWVVPVWTAAFEIPGRPAPRRSSSPAVALEVRDQLLDGRVLLADLADLAADADRLVLRLVLADPAVSSAARR